MARPRKEGLDYFPLDVGFFEEDVVQLITAEFGFKAELILVRLLCKIYRNGYYYEWGDDECYLLSKAIGAVDCSAKFVSEVVNGLVRRCFFDKECFDSFGVLTSLNIQETFKLAVSKSRRKLDTGSMQYWLLPNEVAAETIINSEETLINSEETTEITALSAQSKVNESKLNNTTVNESKKNNLSLESEVTQEERDSFYKIFFFKNFNDPKSEVENFIDHYEARCWKPNNSQAICSTAKQRLSLAKSWRQKQKSDKAPKFFKSFLDKWRPLHEEVKKVDPSFATILITEITAGSFSNDRFLISITPTLYELKDKWKRIAEPIILKMGCGVSISN